MWIRRLVWGTDHFSFLQVYDWYTHTFMFIYFQLLNSRINSIWDKKWMFWWYVISNFILSRNSIFLRHCYAGEAFLTGYSKRKKKNPNMWSRNSKRLLGWSLSNLSFIFVFCFVQLQHGYLTLNLWLRLMLLGLSCHSFLL